MDILFLPRDLIACLTLGGGFLLLALGYDGLVGSMMMAVTIFYFGAEGWKGRKKEQEGLHKN